MLQSNKFLSAFSCHLCEVILRLGIQSGKSKAFTALSRERAQNTENTFWISETITFIIIIILLLLLLLSELLLFIHYLMSFFCLKIILHIWAYFSLCSESGFWSSGWTVYIAVPSGPKFNMSGSENIILIPKPALP